jgi:hypothetical protein
MPPAGGILDSSPANHLDVESLPGSGPLTLQWSAHPGYLICAAHIQLAGGSAASPTYAFPSYPTPLPLGGQYNEAAGGPGSAISSITLKIAKTPEPVGSSCNDPEESTLLGNNPPQGAEIPCLDRGSGSFADPATAQAQAAPR